MDSTSGMQTPITLICKLYGGQDPQNTIPKVPSSAEGCMLDRGGRLPCIPQIAKTSGSLNPIQNQTNISHCDPKKSRTRTPGIQRPFKLTLKLCEGGDPRSTIPTVPPFAEGCMLDRGGCLPCIPEFVLQIKKKHVTSGAGGR